tara:strand:+ start:2655 stop:3254 length:600 start_codon:yes stop_codon:yes gene_type:complete
MALDAKFNAFKVKHDLGDEAMAEMLNIFNDSFIELAHKLLSSNDIPVKKETSKTVKTSSGAKKFATKIAAEYAAENEFTLDDFDKEKITKKDIDELIKATANTTKKKPVPRLDTTPVAKETKERITKEKCSGITKGGEPCNRPGTEKPDGSNKCFCFRHAMDWKMYEISSDSDLEEEEILKDPNSDEKIDVADLVIQAE